MGHREAVGLPHQRPIALQDPPVKHTGTRSRSPLSVTLCVISLVCGVCLTHVPKRELVLVNWSMLVIFSDGGLMLTNIIYTDYMTQDTLRNVVYLCFFLCFCCFKSFACYQKQAFKHSETPVGACVCVCVHVRRVQPCDCECDQFGSNYGES